MVAKLSDEQLATLRHILRFRLTTRSALRRMVFRDDPGNLGNHLKRLRDRGLITSGDLVAGGKHRRYYCLTRQGLRRLGERPGSYRPLGASAIVDRFAILEYCARDPLHRSKYRPREFVTAFEELSFKGAQTGNYYLDLTDNQRRIGWIHVHRCANARRDYRRLVHNVLEKRALSRHWKQVFDEGLFVLGIVVAEPARAEELRPLLEDWPEITTRFELVDDLRDLQGRTDANGKDDEDE